MGDKEIIEDIPFAVVEGIIGVANHYLRVDGIKAYKSFLEERYVREDEHRRLVKEVLKARNERIKDAIFLCTMGDNGHIDRLRLLKELGL